jgi:hypothetical protein
MKYDFAIPMRNGKDAIVKVSDEDPAPWTALMALKDALLADTQENTGSKLQRYELFLKLRDHTTDTDYSLDEVALFKKAALMMQTIFAGQVSHLLDQKPTA